MADTVIKVEGMGKRFVLSHEQDRRALTISDGLRGWLRSLRATREVFWALRDVGFEVKRGERLALIGRNGAGKSTLLKVLSRIMRPDEGRAVLRGRVASLLEVGTGFHPELTGRENVFLNGALLGMGRREVEAKLDAIVDFAGVEQFLDTPVKRYSSGMYVRLAFAVAAHLVSDVLLIDEVLAVGDAEFQKKCLGHMRTLEGQGRTLIFVSHNIGAVTSLCDRGIVLDGGRVAFDGSAVDAGRRYMAQAASGRRLDPGQFQGNMTDLLRFHSVTINGSQGDSVVVRPEEPVFLRVEWELLEDHPSVRQNIALFRDGVRLFSVLDAPDLAPLRRGRYASVYEVPARFLRPGEYRVALGAQGRLESREWIWGTDVAAFDVMELWDPDFDRFNLGMVNLPGHGHRTPL